MSKIEAGLLDINKDSIRVSDLVQSTVENLWVTYKIRSGVTTKNFEAILEVESGVPELIVGDGSDRVRTVGFQVVQPC